jgi:hypothetical protein
MADTSPGSCVAGANGCEPFVYGTYSMGNLPGRNFETVKGFTDFSPGTTYMVMDSGIPIEMAVREEKTMTVQGKDLKYWDVGINKIPRRTTNCGNSPSGPVFPGIDCNGPSGTPHVGGYIGGALLIPFYLALPMFDQSLSAAGTDTTLTGYDPADEVTILPCTGNSYCDNRPADFFKFTLKIEPETGLAFSVYGPNMAAVGIRSDTLTPNVPTALVPIYLGTLSVAADEDKQAQLADLQGAPDLINMITIILTVAGIVFILISCCLCALMVASKSAKEVEGTI